MRIRLIAPVVALVLVATLATGAGSTPALHQWSPPTDVSGGAAMSNQSAVVAANGDAALVVQTATGFAGLLRRGGAWSSPVSLDVAGEFAAGGATPLAASRDGRIFAAWISFVNATSVLGVRLAISHPGSTTFEAPLFVVPAEFNGLDSLRLAVDGDGHVVVAAMVSSDGGVTRSLHIVRCDLSGVPLCEAPTVVPGVANVALVEPEPGLISVVWLTATAEVRIADLGPTGLGASTLAATATTPSEFKAWAGSGSVLVQWSEGPFGRRAARIGGVWQAATTVGDVVVDAAFTPDGAMYLLRLTNSGGLEVALTPDATTDTYVHPLASMYVELYPAPAFQMASDGSLVVLWADYSANLVRSAMLVDGIWQTSVTLSPYAPCGGEPILSGGSGDQVLAAWVDFGQPTWLPFVSELLQATTTTSTTSTTAPRALAPTFAC